MRWHHQARLLTGKSKAFVRFRVHAPVSVCPALSSPPAPGRQGLKKAHLATWPWTQSTAWLAFAARRGRLQPGARPPAPCWAGTALRPSRCSPLPAHRKPPGRPAHGQSSEASRNQGGPRPDCAAGPSPPASRPSVQTRPRHPVISRHLPRPDHSFPVTRDVPRFSDPWPHVKHLPATKPSSSPFPSAPCAPSCPGQLAWLAG